MLAAVCAISVLLPVLAQSADMPAKSRSSTKISAQRQPAPSSDGERAFQQNCSRCHNAPQSISPSITGTVIRHMRVRAGLGEKDERAILRFMNP
jgi:cytochrome c5